MFPVKNTLAKYKLRPKKKLGQNFLADTNSLQTIIKAASLSKSDCVLEIGAGIGNLSTLIAPLAGQFWAVEKDSSFKKILQQKLAKFKNTEIIIADILKFNLKNIYKVKKFKIIGNLPYYITSPILVHLIEQRQLIESILITMQLEVAQRIAAPPGNKDYGRLSCLLQFYTKVKIIDTFRKSQFFPRPEVDSALIELSILEEPSVRVKSEKIFFSVVKAIFSQRRKTLLNSLKSGSWGLSKEQLQEMLNRLGIACSVRGEKLSLSEIGRIADEIADKNS